MLYQMYELNHFLLTPANIMADGAQKFFKHPFSPMTYTEEGRAAAAGWEVMERLTRRFKKPEFGIESIETLEGEEIDIVEEVIDRKNFCHLLHFKRQLTRVSKTRKKSSDLPRVLIVAPLSGHYATLLRDTVRALLQSHDVYITDWTNAREVPLYMGSFSLEDYIDYVIEFLHDLGPNTHIVAVCQPSVPVMAAASIMNANKDPCLPRSMTLMGGPIDTRNNPTRVNKEVKTKNIDWFNENSIANVPLYYPGCMRRVCPGFVMLSGFMSMNLERHIEAHMDFYNHLIEGDHSSTGAHRRFYDEYLSVMDLPAEYFLESVRAVFMDHDLPKSKLMWRGQKIDLKSIEKTALLTVEGEKDDISAPGQTKAAHGLCKNLPKSQQEHYLQKGVGHYGIFNGRRWRTEIMPRVRNFIETQ